MGEMEEPGEMGELSIVDIDVEECALSAACLALSRAVLPPGSATTTPRVGTPPFYL